MCSPSPWPDLGLPRAPLPQPHSQLPLLSSQAALQGHPAPCDCYTAALESAPPLHTGNPVPLAGSHAATSARGVIGGRGLGGAAPPPRFPYRGRSRTTAQGNGTQCESTLGRFKPPTSNFNAHPCGLDGVKCGGGFGFWPLLAMCHPKTYRSNPTKDPAVTGEQVGLALQKHSVDLRLG